MGDVDLEVREAIQNAAANQVPETTGFVVLHADDSGGFVAVAVSVLAPGNGLVIAVYKNRQIQVTEGFPHHIKFRRIEFQTAEVGTASDQALGSQLCASVTYFSRRRFRCIERCMSPEHQAIRGCGAVFGQRVVDGAGEWHGEFGFSPIHVAMGRDGNHLQVLPCGIHTGQAHFWVSPA
ncbi:hypothetical protein D3C76_1284570 [compost metagenome]